MAGVEQGYEFFEHTADVGIRAWGTTLDELFSRAAQALVELMAEDTTIRPEEERSVALSAPGLEALLLAWLQELLFWFSTDRFLPASYAFDTLTPQQVRARVRGSRFDPRRDAQGREVKAITRYRLDVRRTDSGWRAEVVVDI